jgi:phenylacetate-CoA ligase
VLKRIVGRSRNMVRTPEGKCYWPSFPASAFLETADVRQFQLRQTALDRIEAVVAMDRELNPAQMKLIEQKLQHSLNYPFHIDFRRVDAIPVQANGKYEDFISLL